MPSLPAYNNKLIQMSQQDDFSKPRNLAASIFRDDLGDFELPQNSNIQKLPKQDFLQPNIRQSKYQEDTDDDFLDINLGFQSHIASKPAEQNYSSSTTAQSQSNDKKTQPAITTKFAPSRIQKKTRRPEPVKKQVDIDGQIGEIAEWAERGAKNNSDDEDFDDNKEAEKVGQTKEQIQIRKKLQQKLKGGFNTQKKQTGGLRAKAQQLRKENEGKTKLQQIKEQSQEMSKAINDAKVSLKKNTSKDEQKQKVIEQEHNRSSMQLVEEKKPTNINEIFANEMQNEDDIDDHWNKINAQTINQITAVQQKRKQMTLKSVLNYYQKQFQFDETEIDDDAIGIDNHAQAEEEDEEVGCFASLCACLKSEKRSTKVSFNSSIAKRLVAISKKHLANGDQQFFILKEIWTRLTSKQFSRYGGHWNEIGFQGRDPATDLRSTGILSLLQWMQFIEAHPKLSQKYSIWSIENEYPLALTFIKLTGVFLDLLSRGDIVADSWSGFQNCFNCLVWGMFGKMMGKQMQTSTIGNSVEEQAKLIKKQYKKILAGYQQQFKKIK